MIISLINLGCTKNLVDSQFLLGKFLAPLGVDEIEESRISYCTDPFDLSVELVLLNTCGFISSGREEALQTVKKLLKRGKKVCITGCGVKYREELAGDLEREQLKPKVSIYPRNELNQIFLTDIPRALTNLDYGFEYLKIAEGCNNNCSFCIIPQIRGVQQSMPIEKALKETKNLISQGAKEIILIAQDSTRYGTDLYGKPQLFELLEEIEKLEGNFMYRILYLYPDLLTKKQLEKLTKFKKFIPYFDLPFQHISSPVLKRMKRFYNEEKIYEFLDFIKANFPVHFIRTNFIIGFPGETAQDVQKLHDFINKDYFDNIALFEYHDEPLAESYKLSDKIDDKLLHERFLAFRRQVNKILDSRQDNLAKNIGFVVDIYESKGIKLTVRPRLHCPDIDDLVDIPLEAALWSDEKEIGIGTKIEYTN